MVQIQLKMRQPTGKGEAM